MMLINANKQKYQNIIKTSPRWSNVLLQYSHINVP